VASITLEGMSVAMAIEGSTTAEVFEAYVERFLAPALEGGRAMILDNLGAHKGDRVRELKERRGCELIFLPAYSPDFSPIEEAFSKVKMLLKKAACGIREALVEEIGRALQAVSSQEARGYFAHCGYRVEPQCS
jgi:transposase